MANTHGVKVRTRQSFEPMKAAAAVVSDDTEEEDIMLESLVKSATGNRKAPAERAEKKKQPSRIVNRKSLRRTRTLKLDEVDAGNN